MDALEEAPTLGNMQNVVRARDRELMQDRKSGVSNPSMVPRTKMCEKKECGKVRSGT